MNLDKIKEVLLLFAKTKAKIQERLDEITKIYYKYNYGFGSCSKIVDIDVDVNREIVLVTVEDICYDLLDTAAIEIPFRHFDLGNEEIEMVLKKDKEEKEQKQKIKMRHKKEEREKSGIILSVDTV